MHVGRLAHPIRAASINPVAPPFAVFEGWAGLLITAHFNSRVGTILM